VKRTTIRTVAVLLSLFFPGSYQSLCTAGELKAGDQHVLVHAGHLKHILLDGFDAKGIRISSEKAPAPAFELVKKPSQGTLSGKAPRLIYLPKAGFRGADTFTFVVSSGSAKSAVATVTLEVKEWSPPIGIPSPAFGIKECHTMYAKSQIDRGNGLAPYPLSADGPYTHYVDNTHAAATDEGNPFGSSGKPRKSIPLLLPAGSVVEVHGGPYSFAHDRSGHCRKAGIPARISFSGACAPRGKECEI